MKKSKNTKRALLASVLSTMLCIAMLIGSTFAWFTDTASTAVNKIQSGTLDVALEMKEGDNWVSAEGKTLGWLAKDGRPQEEILWEPGCTYTLPEIRVVNNGNLALKFKVTISGIVGDAKLLEVIDFTYGELDVNAEGHLAAGAPSKAITIEGHMRETAGNEYQNLSIDGIGITVVATQDTVESDSYGNKYDQFAPISSFEFKDKNEAKFFCPVCYEEKKNHQINYEDCQHEPMLDIENGVANIKKAGAWTEYVGLDWEENQYVLEYDVNVEALAEGAVLAFDSGETTAWADLQLAVKKVEGNYVVYNDLSGKSKEFGTINPDFHIKYTYKMTDSGLSLNMIVSDGVKEYNTSRTSNVKSPNLCWDIYTTTGSEGNTYGYIDNFKFHYAPLFKLATALEKGGNIYLPENAGIRKRTKISKDTNSIVL